jgi:hypothetical protein
MWKGADFKLRIRKVAGYQNYDSSEFASPAALLDDDSELEKIWKSEHSLKVLLDPKEFKSYDDLKGRLDKVLGDAPAPKTTVEQAKAMPKKPVDEELMSEEDDDLAYFAKLAEE